MLAEHIESDTVSGCLPATKSLSRMRLLYPFWVRKQVQKLYTAKLTHGIKETVF